MTFRVRLDPTESGRNMKLPLHVSHYHLFATILSFNPDASREREFIISLNQAILGGENGCWFSHHSSLSVKARKAASSPNSPVQDQQKEGVSIKWRESMEYSSH